MVVRSNMINVKRVITWYMISCFLQSGVLFALKVSNMSKVSHRNYNASTSFK